jgi:hypothetical protein
MSKAFSGFDKAKATPEAPQTRRLDTENNPALPRSARSLLITI